MTFLEREKELRELADEANHRLEYIDHRCHGVDMDEKWAPVAVYEHEELFSRNSREIIAVVEAVENWTEATHFQLDYPEIVKALDALDKKAGEG